MNTQIIAIANQKGGVGKTTTCANLGIGLAQAGKKVLLIDGDPQGSLTISLGNPQPDKLPFTLSDAMGKILMDQPIRPGEGILHHAEGVDLMPADIQLSGMEVSLVNAMSRETVLRQYLDTLKGQYSHTMQSIGMTGKQLRRLMVYEGIYYAAGADIIGGAVAAILAVTVLKSALNGPSMWFFTLNITLVPVLVIGVLYLLLAAVIPLIVLHFFNKGTVVERLRTSE